MFNNMLSEEQKAVYDMILNSAMRNDFYQRLLREVMLSVEGPEEIIRNSLGDVLVGAMHLLTGQILFEEWESMVRVDCLCLGGISLDLQRFMEAVHEECDVELEAYSYTMESFALRRDVSIVAEKIKRMINNKWGISEEDEIEYDDFDPLNGRFVNEEYRQLSELYDRSAVEGDEIECDRIHQKRIEILEKEVVKGTPLALFYLGVCHCTGSGVKKNLRRARELLLKAEALGVRRASSFLCSYELE